MTETVDSFEGQPSKIDPGYLILMGIEGKDIMARTLYEAIKNAPKEISELLDESD